MAIKEIFINLDIEKIRKDMEKIDDLTDAEVREIASKLNEHINIPWIGEGREAKILFKIVKKIDQWLYTVLPREYYEILRSLDDGISEEEAEVIKIRLAKLINNYVNIPYLTENMEQKAFEFVLDVIIKALCKDSDLKGVIASLD